MALNFNQSNLLPVNGVLRAFFGKFPPAAQALLKVLI
jgi:hypothetical protein